MTHSALLVVQHVMQHTADSAPVPASQEPHLCSHLQRQAHSRFKKQHAKKKKVWIQPGNKNQAKTIFYSASIITDGQVRQNLVADGLAAFHERGNGLDAFSTAKSICYAASMKAFSRQQNRAAEGQLEGGGTRALEQVNISQWGACQTPPALTGIC